MLALWTYMASLMQPDWGLPDSTFNCFRMLRLLSKSTVAAFLGGLSTFQSGRQESGCVAVMWL